jgi:hypothetical protein
MTQADKEDSYSGVVSLKSMWPAMLTGELNGLSSMVGVEMHISSHLHASALVLMPAWSLGHSPDTI